MGERGESVRPKLVMPYYPDASENKAYFNNPSADVKIVSDYTRLDFNAVEDMEIFGYYGYLHDAVVWNCSRSEAGKEYLEKAYNHSQKEPDRDKLRSGQNAGVIGGRYGK